MARGRRLLIAFLAIVATGSAVLGAVIGASQDDPPERGAVAGERAGRSFLAQIVPPPAKRRRASGPEALPRDAAALARALPLERRVAQLFLLGFDGTDLNAEIFRRLRSLDLGGIVIGNRNYTGSDLLGALAGEARVIAEEERHVRPFVMVSQPGGELNSFPDLPPPTAPAELRSADDAAAEAAESASALTTLGVTGVLGPALDVSPEGGSALGALAYSDDPAEVTGFANAVLAAYRDAGMFTAASHFPGLGSADQSTEDGPASVGLDLPELRDRDLLPFRAAIQAGAPAVLLSHALYPMNDFTAPGSLSVEVATDLLRDELGYQGVAITDDLAEPAVEIAASVPQAAVQAVRAGADMLLISGPASDQQDAYDAVLAAVRRGAIKRARLDQAVARILAAKQDYGLLG
ncbi:MAG TPA: glycoside hydrolase family 3 N-terminal domain-containing protein [Thermoleophilaceae bacterium]|nr:glycoside hydrolase family 3 N-terminal domain-containing protein [Thermoleophilaceae bacterium]